MRQIKRMSDAAVLWPALALAVSAFALPACGQSGGTSGSGTTSQEMQRGVPGVDVDTRTAARPQGNGVPGVDVDVRASTATNSGVPGVDVDTRASGAAGASDATGQRTARADRN